MRMGLVGIAVGIAACGLSAGCASSDPDEELSEAGGTGDLAVGSVEGEATSFGSALSCKPIPNVAALTDPEIVISLDGLTLHLRDRKGTYDRVFAIGPGAIEGGKSLTPVGQFYTGSNTTEVTDGKFGYYYPCRIWHTDEDNRRIPVFAGLPFIRLVGPPTAGYGIHGPIDGYSLPSGGNLRRGYVSHGCARMGAPDIVEVYGRIKGRPKVPVRIQKDVERRADGTAVDLESKWVGAECAKDTDCNFTGGICRRAAGTTRGACTVACTKGCSDRSGEVPTFCVDDPASTVTSAGICVPQASTTYNNYCDRYENGLKYAKDQPRPDKSAKAGVCQL